jgi:glycosyltransferase involved in cell wall biosynthesis
MGSKPSLLFINQYYWPDEAATAQLLEDLARWLVRCEYSVTVLCGRSRYKSSQRLSPESFFRDGVRIERVGGSGFGRFCMAGRLIDGVSFLMSAWLRLCSLPRHDLVVAMTSPPWVGVLGAWYRARRRVPFVLWLQDVYPDVAERLEVLGNPLMRRALHGLSRWIYRESSRIVVLAQGMAGTLASHAVAADKPLVIPNWANLDDIVARPVCGNRFRAEHDFGDDPVLMYAGNVGLAHEIDTMLSLVSALQREVPSLRFVLVGDSPRHLRLMEEAKRRNIHRATRLGFQPRARLGELLGAADAHLVAQKPQTEGLLVSSKFYGAVGAGRPVIFIGSPDSEIGRQVRQAQLGAVVEPGQVPAGIEAAKKALLMTRDDSGAVSRIRAWAEEHASHRVRLPQFAAALGELLAGRTK